MVKYTNEKAGKKDGRQAGRTKGRKKELRQWDYEKKKTAWLSSNIWIWRIYLQILFIHSF